MKVCIITGASSGMGYEMALQVDKIYSETLDEIWLVARRTDRLEKLSSLLNHKVRILPLDLTSKKDLAELELSLNLLNPNVKLLVNAAGYGIVGPFKSGQSNEQSGMIRLNCEALTKVTYMVLKYMKKGARIIQFASTAAFLPQTGFGVYAATKAYVLSFSRALNEELKEAGISVTAVCPGPVNTEFFKIAEKNGSNFNFKKYFMEDAREVVHAALYDSYKRHAVSISSPFMWGLLLISKIIPHDLILRILSKIK